MASSPDVASLLAELERASRLAEEVTDGLTPTQLGQPPAAGAWSVAECLDHLSLTTEAYLPMLDGALRAAERLPKLNGRTLRLDWLGRVLRWVLQPGRMRSRTADAFLPRAVRPETALPRFLDGQRQVETQLRRADGLAIDRVTVYSPFNRSVRYSAYSAYVLLVTHEFRHLEQARRARLRVAG